MTTKVVPADDLPDPPAPKRLASRSDRAVQTHALAGITPETLAADEAQDLDPANIAELEREIARTKDPKLLAMLVDEHNRIKEKANTVPADDLPAPPAPAPAPAPVKAAPDRNRVAQNPLTKFAMGAASPFTGIAQLMEKAQSGMSEFMGGPKLDTVQKHMGRVDELAKTGDDDLLGTGADIAGSVLSPLPLGAAARGTGLVRKALTNAGVGAGTNVAIDAGKDPIKAALMGAGAGGGLTVAAALAKNAGKAGDLLLGLPGSGERAAARIVKDNVGTRHADEVADALRRAEPFETSGQAVSATSGGVPLVAMQKNISRTKGGVSADFDSIYQTQRMNPATPDELVRRALYDRPAHRGGFSLNIAKEIGGDIPVISKMPVIRSLIQGRAEASEPRVREALSRLLRNPLEMAEALRDLPPNQRQRLVEFLVQRSPASAAVLEKESE